ncbi:MAG: CRISPR-associated endonuclease Cas2 [Actinobacteria bacterium]|nr:CRISPR-associated endonuclease Cas2 [Actinomycetota bacterium]MBI3689023.1 CRISPR-associated endonuclease Cas2 [Actinomycetota bacterium]
MARRRYLVAYDIRQPRRLRRVCTIMETYGDRLQYSVFICDLSAAELGRLEHEARAAMDLTEDSILRIDLGPTNASAEVRFLGRHRPLPGTRPQIV